MWIKFKVLLIFFLIKIWPIKILGHGGEALAVSLGDMVLKFYKQENGAVRKYNQLMLVPAQYRTPTKLINNELLCQKKKTKLFKNNNELDAFIKTIPGLSKSGYELKIGDMIFGDVKYKNVGYKDNQLQIFDIECELS